MSRWNLRGGARSDGRDFATISRRSASTWTVRATGNTGHSSGIFRERVGSGAIYELARILTAFHDQLREPYLTYNVGVMLGGTDVRYDEANVSGTVSGKDNIIAKAAVAEGDLRTVSDEQLQRVREKMRQIVAKHLPATGAEITFHEVYPAMAPTAGNRKLMDLLNTVNRDLRREPTEALDPMQRGAGDISFVAFMDGLAGMGANGSGAHAPGESVDLSRLPLQAKRAALLIYRLTR